MSDQLFRPLVESIGKTSSIFFIYLIDKEKLKLII